MCVIVAHRPGARLPTIAELENCFWMNNHGAGIAYINTNNQIQIDKGYMRWIDFEDRYMELDFKTNNPFLLHFRIGTQGPNDAGNCHPFPLSRNICDLRNPTIETDIAMVHNGVLWSSKDEELLSDTMEFVRDYASSKLIRNNLKNEVVRSMLKSFVAPSKLAFMINDGTIITVGEYIEEDGLLFSNDSYEDGKWIGTGYQSKQSKGVGYNNRYPYHDENYYDNISWFKCDYCGYSCTELIDDEFGYGMCPSCAEPKKYWKTEHCDECKREVHVNSFRYSRHYKQRVCLACYDIGEDLYDDIDDDDDGVIDRSSDDTNEDLPIEGDVSYRCTSCMMWYEFKDMASVNNGSSICKPCIEFSNDMNYENHGWGVI